MGIASDAAHRSLLSETFAQRGGLRTQFRHRNAFPQLSDSRAAQCEKVVARCSIARDQRTFERRVDADAVRTRTNDAALAQRRNERIGYTTNVCLQASAIDQSVDGER